MLAVSNVKGVSENAVFEKLKSCFMANSTSKHSDAVFGAIKPAIPLLIYAPISLSAKVALGLNWPSELLLVQIPLTLLAGYTLFCWTSCFHEVAHQTLFRPRWMNVLLGRFIGTLIFVPYSLYRDSHIRHHAYLNKPTDWELWPYSDPNTSLWFRRIFCWLELPLGLFTSPIAYSQLYFSKRSPLRNPQVHRTITFEYLVMSAVWLIVLGTVAWFSAWDIFLRAWLIPHCLAGIFQTFRKFTEHLGMQSYDPLLGTRTVIGKGIITRLCSFFNYHIFAHGIHHRHPRIDHGELRTKMESYQSAHPDVSYPVFNTYWDAIRHMLPSALFDPGVGMNRGAPRPEDQATVAQLDFAETYTGSARASRPRR